MKYLIPFNLNLNMRRSTLRESNNKWYVVVDLMIDLI